VYAFSPSGCLEGNKIKEVVLNLAKELPHRDEKKMLLVILSEVYSGHEKMAGTNSSEVGAIGFLYLNYGAIGFLI